MTSEISSRGLRWGILGPGGIAQAFASDLVQSGLTVQAVGSRSAEAARLFAERFGVPNAHNGYADLVGDPEVDVVYVATPHPFHAEQAMLALNAGKHVLIEKPFTLNGAEAEEVVTLAREKGLVVLEAMWTRFLPHMARIHEIVASGILGDVRTLIADHTQDLPDDPSHRINNMALGGGALLDLGIYPISFASSLFGPPQTVQATATFAETGADSSIATLFGYANGSTALTISASDQRGPNTATILGTEGRIDVDGVWYAPTSFRVYNSAGEVVETFSSTVAGRGMQYEAFEFERLVAEGLTETPLLPLDETVRIMHTLDDIRSQIGLVYPGE
ncbi:Gfo/Idh/MocA family oxidoreductase [Okibacterium endophyticum]